MDTLDYRELLGLETGNKFKTKMFFNTMENKLNRIIEEIENSSNVKNYKHIRIRYSENNLDVTEDELKNLLDKLGKSYETIRSSRFSYFEEFFNILFESSDIKEFVWIYITFIHCLTETNNYLINKKSLIDLLKDTLEKAHINYFFKETLDEEYPFIILFDGNTYLDKKLISQNLIDLENYPKSLKAFKKSIIAYSNRTDSNASDVADSMRKALETFLQEFFNSDKSLEKLIPEYGNYLKEKNINSELSNIFPKLIDLYSKYNNNNAKHHDKTDFRLLEFLLYQTGILIRLLLTLKN